MPETMALLRLAVVKNRVLLSVMITAVIAGMITFWVTLPAEADLNTPEIAFAALWFALVPPAFATVLLFDYGSEGDMNLPDSGCNHWLLRMPIHSWKIAVVPIAMKTAWVSGLWLLFVATLRSLGTAERVPLFAPCLALSGSAIWLLVIGWRPFRTGWQRILALVIAAPVIYCVIMGAIGSPFIDRVEWRPTAVLASNAASIVFYLAAVWTAIQSVDRARFATAGLIPAKGGQVSAAQIHSVGERHFRGPWHALLHKDWLKTQRGAKLMLIVAVIPTIVLFTLFVPLNVVTVVLAFILFSYYGGIAVGRTGGPEDNPPTIEVFLAASPIKTSTLAWTRMISMIGIVAIIYACIVFVFAGWLVWPENRATWSEWAAGLPASMQIPASMEIQGDTFWMGVRVSLAITIGWTVILHSRIASFCWIGMTGRTWIGVAAAVVAGMAILIPLGIFLSWFMQQTDWETTRAEALRHLQWAPTLVLLWLGCKLVASIASGWQALSQRVVSSRELTTIVGLWLGSVFVIGTVMAALIPDPRATWWWCISLTAIVVPLTSVLLAPVALAWNRHR